MDNCSTPRQGHGDRSNSCRAAAAAQRRTPRAVLFCLLCSLFSCCRSPILEYTHTLLNPKEPTEPTQHTNTTLSSATDVTPQAVQHHTSTTTDTRPRHTRHLVTPQAAQRQHSDRDETEAHSTTRTHTTKRRAATPARSASGRAHIHQTALRGDWLWSLQPLVGLGMCGAADWRTPRGRYVRRLGCVES